MKGEGLGKMMRKVRRERRRKQERYEPAWDINADRLAAQDCSVQLEGGHSGESQTALNLPSVRHYLELGLEKVRSP